MTRTRSQICLLFRQLSFAAMNWFPALDSNAHCTMTTADINMLSYHHVDSKSLLDRALLSPVRRFVYTLCWKMMDLELA